MPVVLTVGRFQFVIYLNDHNPAHVHVKAAGAEAKITLSDGNCYWARGFDQKTLNWLEKIVIEHADELLEAWNEFYEEKK